ncbi:MAG: hypothetical protein HY928_12295 [Elusimicrobia bacterium]|nr:hypothetical protein [Elusimicrobiota bacterium]
MAEEPGFRFAADPAKSRYGPVVHGLKTLIDGISRSTGLGSAQVVAAILAAAGLSLALVVGAVIVIARDTGPARPEPLSDYVPGGPPPPDRAVLNAGAQAPSPAPTDVLGDRYQGTEPDGALPAGSAAPRTIPLPSFLKSDRQAAPDEDEAETPVAAGTRDRAAWLEPRPWRLKEGDHREMFGGTTPSGQRSTAQQDVKEPKTGSVTGGNLSRSAAERAGGLAGQLPSVPDVGGGVVLGGELPPPRDDKRKGGAAESKRPKSGGTTVEGPVIQEKIPDVGPGQQISEVQSGPGPAAQNRIGPAGQDMLSVPIDVNRIQLDANKANDVDRSPGVHVIGQ